jgi:hypothetical protein
MSFVVHQTKRGQEIIGLIKSVWDILFALSPVLAQTIEKLPNSVKAIKNNAVTNAKRQPGLDTNVLVSGFISKKGQPAAILIATLMFPRLEIVPLNLFGRTVRCMIPGATLDRFQYYIWDFLHDEQNISPRFIDALQ